MNSKFKGLINNNYLLKIVNSMRMIKIKIMRKIKTLQKKFKLKIEI